MNISRKPGLYIHIPFCISKCGYCDFYSIVDTSLTNTFINALLDEIKITSSQFKAKDLFDTVYFGGGTPSLLKPDQISRILDTLSEYYLLDDDCEITSEINPGTLGTLQLKELFDLGFNRISIGVQSFVQDELKLLDRIHTVEESVKTIHACRGAGFEKINLDLIFAIPNQSTINWKYSLKKALSFSPEHLSVYNLTYEEKTPFYLKLKAGQIVRLDEQKEIEYFSMAHDLLTISGYSHYEISNYANSESEYSRHNYKYWQHTPYLGFGPSAHSFWENSRWANIRSVDEYVLKIKNGELPRLFEEKLKEHQLISEHIFLALRTYQGLSLAEFENLFGFNFLKKFVRESQKLIENKLAIIKDDYFRLTEKGILICDEILLQFTIENQI
jgi:oxygen-independent coproporphyrinogen-3 oxidase